MKRATLYRPVGRLWQAALWACALGVSPVQAGWGTGELVRLVSGWAGASPASPPLSPPPLLLAPLDEAERHASLTPEQRQQMREQMREQWQGMTPDERSAHRRSYREERPPIDREERQRIRQEMIQSAPSPLPPPPHGPHPHRRGWD